MLGGFWVCVDVSSRLDNRLISLTSPVLLRCTTCQVHGTDYRDLSRSMQDKLRFICSVAVYYTVSRLLLLRIAFTRRPRRRNVPFRIFEPATTTFQAIYLPSGIRSGTKMFRIRINRGLLIISDGFRRARRSRYVIITN